VRFRVEKTKVAVVGLGSQGLGIAQVLRKTGQVEIVAVADIDKRALEKATRFVPDNCLVTQDPMEIFSKSPDVLVEATPTITEAALLVRQAIRNKTHVILTNSEVDQMFGRLLAKEAESNHVTLTSDAGDQPGVMIRTMKDVSRMGFEIVMAGNVKGFLDRYATPESIIREAEIRRLSLKQCTAYTDGTKLAIEMALVANAKGLDILQTGMTGPRIKHVQDVMKTFDLTRARKLGGVVDYVLGAEPGGSVFVIGYSEDSEDRFYMNYYKMGAGPYYLFTRPYHLCHYETPFAIESVMKYHEPVLVQKHRILEVGCRAKMDLQSNTKLEGIGGHHLYGVLEHTNALPIGMAENTVLLKPKKRDEPVSWDDVEFPPNDPRLELWNAQSKLGG
jgi:predicted homoserine dehydrogenase-like protein